MNRTDDFLNKLEEIEFFKEVEEYMEAVIKNIQDNRADFIIDMLAHIQGTIDNYVSLQEQSLIGAIENINFMTLKSNILVGKYGFTIGMYDEKLFLSKSEILLDWKPNKIFDFIDVIFKKMEKVLKNNFIGVQPYEILDIKFHYILEHTYYYVVILQEMLVLSLKFLDISKLKTKDKIFINYGLYMEEPISILEWTVNI